MRIAGVVGLPEITAGDDLAHLIADAMTLLDGDVVVITSKVVSKAEGAVVDLATVDPSPFAADYRAAGPRTRASSRSCCPRLPASYG